MKLTKLDCDDATYRLTSELGIAVYGDTPEEVVDKMTTAITLLFRTMAPYPGAIEKRIRRNYKLD